MDRHTEILAPRLIWLAVGAALAALPWVLTLHRTRSPAGPPAGIEADEVEPPRALSRAGAHSSSGRQPMRTLGGEASLAPVPAGVTRSAESPEISTPARMSSAAATQRARIASETDAARGVLLGFPPIDRRTAAVLRTGFPAAGNEVCDRVSDVDSAKTAPIDPADKQHTPITRLPAEAPAAGDDSLWGTDPGDEAGQASLRFRVVSEAGSSHSPDSAGRERRQSPDRQAEGAKKELSGDKSAMARNSRAIFSQADQSVAQGPRLLVPGAEPAPVSHTGRVDQQPSFSGPMPEGKPDATDSGPADSLADRVPADPPDEAPGALPPGIEAPTAILQPPASPLMPRPAYAGHSAELERIARQADQQTRKGFELAGHRAYFAARARFIAALRLMAQGLDMEHQTKAHSHALAAGLRAMKEAEDFLPAPGELEADLDIPAIVAGHQTPVLKGMADETLPPYSALRCYLTFAQEQLAAAGGREVASSMALHGLGKLHAALAQDRAAPIRACEPKAVACFQAALLVFPRNFMAANDLAVLLARREDYEHARALLEHSLSICPQSTGWHNLAVVYERLGLVDLARRAERVAQVWHQAELARRGGQPAGYPRIQWVDPATFARYQTDFPGAGPPQPGIGPAASAPADTSAAAQPGGPPAGSHFARRVPSSGPPLPNRR